MFASHELHSLLVFLAIFLGVCGLLLFISVLSQSDRWLGIHRLQQMAGSNRDAGEGFGVRERAQAFLQKAGTLILPAKNQSRVRLETRLTQAGLYSPSAVRVFLGVKLILTGVLPVAALGLYVTGLLSLQNTLLAAFGAGFVGLLAPGMWVDHLRKKRQSTLRQALPDALDLLVLCVDGGMSLAGALQRVTEDLEMAHPLLTAELNIVQRATVMGSGVGDAFKMFADRSGLEEVRDLSSVLLQSERFGVGVAKALRVHADECRQERQQRAEEMAQKAGVKILFPTLLCIFPAIFIVLLGPAAYQLMELFSKTR